MLPVLATLRPWADPAITSLNRLPMHTPIHRAERVPLDGEWGFTLYDHPDAVPADAVAPGAPSATTAVVPGNWTLHPAVDDRPHYTNVQMPFPGPPPALPERQPVGVYRRRLTLPRGFRGRQAVLHVGGAESVHAVYLNGEFAGYGTDSRLPSEYDVTPLLQAGANDLAIVVWRYSALSYVEDQDQWWMAGLHRSVFIEARTPVHFADVRCHADLQVATGTGQLQVTAQVGFVAEPARGYQVRTTLLGPSGRRVGAASVQPVPHQHAAPYVFEGFLTRHAFTVPSVQPWSAENPTRYTVQLELLKADGTVVDSTSQRIGCRHGATR